MEIARLTLHNCEQGAGSTWAVGCLPLLMVAVSQHAMEDRKPGAAEQICVCGVELVVTMVLG